MKNFRGGLLALTALVSIGAQDITAQPAQGRRGGGGPRGGVEAIMANRDRLELTDAQVADLDAIRREAVEERNALQAEMEEMRSQLEAGQIRQSEMMAFMEERRDEREGVADARRERIESILTEEQLETVRSYQAQRGAYMRGRADAGGRGMGRPGAGFRRDGRGAMGPGAGMGRGGPGGPGQGFRGPRGPGRGFAGPRFRRGPGGDFGPRGPGAGDQGPIREEGNVEIR